MKRPKEVDETISGLIADLTQARRAAIEKLAGG
jgi:hypothetical protein